MNKRNEAEKAMAEIDEMINKLEAIRSAKKEQAKKLENGSITAKTVDDGMKTSVELEIVDMNNENIKAVMASLIEAMVDGKDNHAEVLADFVAGFLMQLKAKKDMGI